MVDWMTLLLPLAVLAIVALFPFVGCGDALTLAESDPPPLPPPAPEPGAPQPPRPPPPPPSPPPVATILELRLKSDINVVPPTAPQDGVASVVVTWTLTKSTALPADPVPQPLEVTLARLGSATLILGPGNSHPAIRFITAEQLKLYDRVTCQCDVRTRALSGAGGLEPQTTVVTNAFALTANQRHIVQLEPNFTDPTADPREFSLVILPSEPGVGPTAPTRLQLNPSIDPLTHVNTLKPTPAPQYKLLQVRVTWTLAKTGGGPLDQPLTETMVRTIGTRSFLEPDGTPADPPAMWDLTSEQLADYDTVSCQCEVTTRPINLADTDTDVFLTPPVSFPIKRGTPHVIELEPDWTQVNAKPRRFDLHVRF